MINLQNIQRLSNLLVLLVPFLLYGEESNNERLEKLVSEALQKNPALEAATQRVAALEETISQSRALPDPKLTVGLMNLPVNSFAFDQEPMTGKLLSVMQMFPLAGKLSLNKKMAEFALEAEQYKKAETQNQIVASVKKAYFELYAIDRGIETVQTNKTLVQQLVDVAQTKYETGSGLQQDVLRAQVELSKIEDDLLMWRQKRVAAEARLNALLNRPNSRDIPVTPTDLQPVAFKDHQELLETTRPLLLAWQEMIKRSETAIARKRRDYWPDLTISASYSQRDDLKNGANMHDFFSTTASINIPLFFAGKQRAAVQQKEAEHAALLSEYQNILNQVKTDSVSVAAEVQRNLKRVQLYEGGILLQTEQSLESALTGYQVGKVDFITLINNWTMLQNYQLQAFQAKADVHISLTKLEQIVGSNEFDNGL